MYLDVLEYFKYDIINSRCNIKLNDKVKLIAKEIVKDPLKELGYSGFLRYIRHSEEISKEYYFKLEEVLFKDMSVDKMFDETKKYWENND